MAWNNGKWREGTNGADTIDLRWQAPWDVRDNASGFDGNDTIYGNIADNILGGGDGADDVFGGDGRDSITGNSGMDYLFGEVGDDLIFGGADNDSLYGNGGADTLDGGSGADYLLADSEDDDLNGGAQNDTLLGGGGKDHLYGDDGNDSLEGQADDDFLNGGDGADTLRGGDGVDVLYGDATGAVGGNDRLNGGLGSDTIIGEGGNDFMQGDDDVTWLGHDFLYDGYGSHPVNDNDTMGGWWGDDTIISVTGADSISGGAGNDEVTLSNAERLLNPAGIFVHGETGNDVLHLNFAAGPINVLTGRPGDIEGFEYIDIEDAGDTDWTLSFRDILDISGGDLVIEGDAGDRVRLDNFVVRDSLSGGDWVESNTYDAGRDESFTTFLYVAGGAVQTQVSIDTDIAVQLI
jgi:Ca2+-binding RTX toxin-like protein